MPLSEDPPDPGFKSNHDADMQWTQYRARKGWPAETLVIILGQYIRERRLSADLLAWMKKRRS